MEIGRGVEYSEAERFGEFKKKERKKTLPNVMKLMCITPMAPLL